ncbi:MAG: cytochrome c family protein, partial [Pseudomonadales bacterium]|nr:cytochrome c family protein [Pseudomonadales bacterium]
QVTRVGDARCQECHAYESFNNGHPEFAFTSEQPTERLAFTHIRHVRELADTQSLSTPEESCVYCHVPTPDGKSFMPLNFDNSCDACHLTSATSTARLPLAQNDEPGVRNLDYFRNAAGPDAQWAEFMPPGEFRESGGRLITKKPLHHRDPWVMANLRMLRDRLYENGGLADLLRTSADVPPDEVRDLYGEAVLTLREHMRGLRGSEEPEVQAELTRVEAALDTIEDRISNPYASLDESRFILDLVPRDDVAQEDKEEIEAVIADLTEACRDCHPISQATIVRPPQSLGKMKRAEFNHRSHILQRSCLDCHNVIPIAERFGDRDEVSHADDHAGIVNLPTIETCQECHTPAGAGDSCVSCHLFHPDKDRFTRPVVKPEDDTP